MKVFLGQAMIGAQNKSFCVADDDAQPMEKAGIGIVGSVFMGVAFQCRDVAEIAIAVDHAVVSESSVGKFLHRCLFDIGCYLHL